jgi:hypothetical protein
MKRISLRYAATCRSCGAALPAGSPADYYGRGRVYGVECHARGDNGLVSVAGDNRVFRRTRHGLRAGYENTGVRCEDAPCCGCC